MDKIFKNDTIMGVVTIVTLALVAMMYFQNRKKDSETTTIPAPAAE